MIEVNRLDDTSFEVRVSNGTETRHRVTLSNDDHDRLTGGKVPAETLIEKSFEFLLEREPNTAILPEFDLTVIGRYFPDYETEIRRACG